MYFSLTLSSPVFSVVRKAREGEGAQRPRCQNQGYHQPIEIKCCMSHYSHKSMPDAKFESVNFSSLGDMTSQNFPLKRERVIEFKYLPVENWFNLKKKRFFSQICFFDPKLTPDVNVNNSQAEKNFLFLKFLRRLNKKRAVATPLIDQFR